MEGRFHPRRQGDAGELSAMQWLTWEGYDVYLPLGPSPDIDLIGHRDGELVRVQVKTSSVWRNGRWEFTICTRGGNQSWTGVVKHFSPDRCDYLFAVATDGRRWFIPASEVGGGNGILVGGPKYAPYEVDRGRPLLAPVAA
jgi:hypothetical protein